MSISYSQPQKSLFQYFLLHQQSHAIKLNNRMKGRHTQLYSYSRRSHTIPKVNLWKQLLVILSSSTSSTVEGFIVPVFSLFPTSIGSTKSCYSNFGSSLSSFNHLLAFQHNHQQQTPAWYKSHHYQLNSVRTKSTATTTIMNLSKMISSTNISSDYDESIEDYLNCILEELNYPMQQQTEEEDDDDDDRSSWIVQDDNGEYHFKVRVRSPNRKPMIRALLGIRNKVEMNQVLRTKKQELEHNLMKHYVESYLLPNLSEEEQEKIKNDILNKKKVPTKNSRGMFQKMATGPIYRGNLQHFIQDKAPATIQQYVQACRSLSETEVLHTIIQEKLDSLTTTTTTTTTTENDNMDNEQRTMLKRRYTAASICLEMFESSSNNDTTAEDEEEDDDEQNDDDNNNIPLPDGKISGIECEQACILFLNQEQKRYNDQAALSSSQKKRKRRIVLSNIYVNNISTSSRPKYHPNNLQFQRYNTSNNNKFRKQAYYGSDNNEFFSSGIIWTHKRRNRKCSELDAIVIELDDDNDEDNHFFSRNNNEDGLSLEESDTVEDLDTKEILIKGKIVEFWEAKSCLNPSTLYDALTKKLSTIQSILEDEDASLTFGGGRYRMKLQPQNNNMKAPVTFGVYAMELLHPSNAVGQLKSMAMAHALDTNLDAIYQAVDKGYVYVPITEVQDDLKNLQDTFYSIPKSFDFVMEINK